MIVTISLIFKFKTIQVMFNKSFITLIYTIELLYIYIIIQMQEIIQHSYDIDIEDGDKNTNIHIWCLNRNSESVLIRIEDYLNFCYIELPLIVNNKPYKWNDYNVRHVIDYIKFVLKDNPPLCFEFLFKKKLYYYQEDKKYPMIYIGFKTVASMKYCEYIFRKERNIRNIGTLSIKVWETNINCVRKLFTIKNIKYTQWFKISAKEVPNDAENRISIPTVKEYIGKWETIEPIDNEGWLTHPKVLAFDIETYSDNHKALPNELNAKHVVYLNSLIYQRIGDPKSRKQYIIIMGECNPIEGVTILHAKTEYDIVQHMANVINELDPDIISGYNILAYDYPYLNIRIKTKMLDWPHMGRLLYKNPVMITKKWSSNAYGYNKIYNLKLEGRITLDLLPIIKRDYKLDKYTLDFVSNYFLKKGKHDVKPVEMFEIYEELSKAESEYKKYPKVIKSIINFQKAKTKMTKVAAYCVQDSCLCVDLFEKLNIWIDRIELSSILGVTITELSTRGQQIRTLSQIYNIASSEYVLDKREKIKTSFEGGFVYNPIPGIYDNIICLDFSSLYPSIIMAYNICFTTLISPDLENKIKDSDCNIAEVAISTSTSTSDESVETEGPIEGYEYKEEEKTVDVSKLVNTKYRFIKKEFRDGIIPRLVRNLVNERKSVKEKIKNIQRKIDKLNSLKQYINSLKEIKHDIPQTTKETKLDIPQTIKEIKHDIPQTFKESKLDIPQTTKETNSEESQITKETKLDIPQTLKESNSKESQITKETKLDIPQTLKESKLDIPQTTKETIEETKLDIQQKNTFDLIKSKIIELDLQNIIKEESISSINDFINSKFAELDLQNTILDKRQNALKVSANSTFGFLGAQSGSMPLIEGAASITSLGRKLINQVNDYIKYKYNGTIVYGDTDSSMFDLHIKDPKECNKIGRKISLEITGSPEKRDAKGNIIQPSIKGLFPPPLAIEFEKAMRIFSIKKKKYAYYVIEEDGSFKKDNDGNYIINKKGIVLARRDNCKYLKEQYSTLLTNIMNKNSMKSSLDIIIKSCLDLLNNKVPLNKLSIIKELGSKYKNNSFYMKVFSDELRKNGKLVSAGDRLEYVVVKSNNESLGMKMRLLDNTDEIKEEIDFVYYIEHLLMNSLDQLFEIGYSSELNNYGNVNYKPKYLKTRSVNIKTPIKLIISIINDYNKHFFSIDEKEKIKYITNEIDVIRKHIFE